MPSPQAKIILPRLPLFLEQADADDVVMQSLLLNLHFGISWLRLPPAITALTSEIKEVKMEINLVRHDMQKLRDRTAALEDRMKNVEDEVAPLQRELLHV